MKIIIPMTGRSSRFKKVGLNTPKQFLKVKNKMVIEHILDMYPNEDDINFIVNISDLNNKNLRPYFNKLEKYNIVEINFQDNGPGAALLESRLLDTDSRTIINYCDFANIWEWEKVKQKIINEDPDGMVPAYSGLHPHSIYGNDYAFIKSNNENIVSIKEKQPFTNDKMSELASTGTYYFKSGYLCKKYIEKVIDKKLFVNNEIYISTPFEEMIKDNLNVTYLKVDYFFQWGTPEDFKEFKYNLDEVENIQSEKTIDLNNVNLVIPAAGEGVRFVNENYLLPKIFLPLIQKPIILNILASFSNQISTKILLLNKLKKESKQLFQNKKNVEIIEIENKTKDQAESAAKLINTIENTHPILVHSADCVLDKNLKLPKEIFDIVIFTKSNYRRGFFNYSHYGWVNSKKSKIESFSIKKKPKYQDSNVISGVFLFRDRNVFNYLYEETRKENLEGKEMHIDYMVQTALKRNMKVVQLSSEKTAILGTPVEYEIFNYMHHVSQYLGK